MSVLIKKLLKLLDRNFFIFLLLLFSWAVITRFWKIEEWTYFSLDQEYAAFLIMKIVNSVNFPLIGVNASNTGLYLGPGFLYIGSLIYALGRGAPVAGSVFSGILSLVFIFLLWRLGQNIVGKKAAFIAVVLWIGSLPIVWLDRKFWNPSFVPLLSLCILYSLYKLSAKNEEKYLYLGSAALGLSLHFHMQLLLLIPAFIYVSLKQVKTISALLKGMGIFLLFQFPQIIFELRYGFVNAKAFLRLFDSNVSTGVFLNLSSLHSLFYSIVRSLGSWGVSELTVEQSPVPELLFSKTSIHPLNWMLITVGIFRCIKILKNKLSLFARSMIVVAFTVIFAVIFYKNPVADYYFLWLFPFVFLAIGGAISHSGNIIRFFSYSTLFLIVISQAVLFFFSTTRVSFSQKMEAINYIKSRMSHSEYRLEIIGNRLVYGGYRYLSEWKGIPPKASTIDPVLGWIYGFDQNFIGPSAIVVLKTDITQEQSNELFSQLRSQNQKTSNNRYSGYIY